MTNLDIIRKHYEFLKHEKTTEIRLFDKGKIEGNRIFTASTIDQFVSIVLKYISSDLGVGINERRLGGIEDKDVTDMKYLAVDIDTKDPEIIKATEEKLIKNGLKWCAKVFTGQKGYHYYFRIKPINDKAEIREILENAKHYFIHDLAIPVDPVCFNPSRVYRIWGTMNKGNEVQLIDFEDNIEPIDMKEFIPERPDEVKNLSLINTDAHFSKQVLDEFPLFEALYKKPEILPLKNGTNFNDILVKNIAAYIQKKGTKNIKPWEKLMKLKKHPVVNLHNWLKKSRFFNPFEIIGNVRKHYPELYKEFCINMKQIPAHTLTYIEDDDLKWNELKRNYRETNNFIINKQFKVSGKLVPIEEVKNTVKLAKIYQGVEDPNFYYKMFFDDEGFSKGLPRVKRDELAVTFLGEINSSFYTYQMTSDTNNRLTILSEEKLDSGRYRLLGALAKINDAIGIGNIGKLGAYSYILFLHSYEKEEMKYNSLKEVYEDFKDVDGDLFYRYLMTETEDVNVPTYYKTSDFWKQIYTAFIFSGTLNKGQKLNMIIFGPTGTGKTPQMNAIREKFDENGSAFTGSSLSIAGLTISFYTSPAKLGALLSSIRLCAVDEFFKIFNKLDDVSQITSCNDYFDNQQVTASSGKQDIPVRATCQVFGVTNPIRKTDKYRGVRKEMTLFEMFDWIDSDFWGRFLILQQTRADQEWVLDIKNQELNTIVPNINKDQFMACYDFFKNINTREVIDFDRLNKIARAVQVPENIESMYKKVCNRIVYLLFDGMIKWKAFTEKRQVIATDLEYLEFEELWDEIVRRWYIGEKELPINKVFSTQELNIIEKIKERSELSILDFNSMCELVDIRPKEFKSRLVDNKIIETDTQKRKIFYKNELEILEDIDEQMRLDFSNEI